MIIHRKYGISGCSMIGSADDECCKTPIDTAEIHCSDPYILKGAFVVTSR